jgi:hypothetical protein
MKLLGLCILLWTSLACLAADDPTGEAWVRRPPGNFEWNEWKELPKTDFYEVAVSRAGLAFSRELAEKPIMLIEPDTARDFTGPGYACPPGKKPWLVRAVFGHGGTGHYTISRRGNELLIHHTSLGRTSPTNKSAIIVNLDFTPTAVYVFRSVAG